MRSGIKHRAQLIDVFCAINQGTNFRQGLEVLELNIKPVGSRIDILVATAVQWVKVVDRF